MTKPVYSIDAPDQARLKIARTKIEAVLAEHDLAGVVVLHTPGMGEFFYRITPSYSVCSIDEAAGALRITSKLERDHGGDVSLQHHDQAATANMTACLADQLGHAALMFLDVDRVASVAMRADHTGAEYVPDPNERRRQ